MKKLLVMIILLGASLNVYSAKKRVLVEQFTSIGCGWCVDGTIVLDSLKNTYPDDIIPIRWHTGSGGPLNNLTGRSLYSAVGSGGIPSATIDRINYEGQEGAFTSYLLGRAYWFHYAEEQMQETAKADVFCNWDYNDDTKTIDFVVGCTILEDMNNQVTLNVLLCENNVSDSTNSGYWQLNYYSNLEGYENHPYYNKPFEIKDYNHNAVVRSSFGGLWGVKANIPRNVLVGEKYEWSFTVKLSDIENGNIINFDNAYTVAMIGIDEPAIADLLNCSYGEKKAINTSLLSVDSDSKIFINNEENIDFTIKNLGETQANYKIEITEIGYGAKDWDINLIGEQQNISVSAGDNYSGKIHINPLSEGIKNIILKVIDENNPNLFMMKEFTIYNTNSKKMYISGTNDRELFNLIELEKMGKSDYVQIKFSELSDEIVNKFDKLELVIHDNTYFYIIGDDNSEFYRELTQKGINVMVMGSALIDKAVYYPKYYPKLQKFLIELGVKSEGHYVDMPNSNPELFLKGYAGDPISNDKEISIMRDDFSQVFCNFSILDYTKARPIFSPTNNIDSILCFRSYLNNQRIVFIGFNLFNIVNNDDKKELFEKTVNWLLTGQGEKQAIIQSNTTDLSYKFVVLGQEKTLDLEINNIGSKTLIISSMELSENNDIYIIDKELTFPIEILANESLILPITFKPIAKKQYRSKLIIKSNDQFDPEITISINGVGKKPSSINQNNFIDNKISLSPNPISNGKTLNIKVEKGILNYTTKIYNLDGVLIAEYHKNDNISIANSFVAGTYILVIENEGKIIGREKFIVK